MGSPGFDFQPGGLGGRRSGGPVLDLSGSEANLVKPQDAGSPSECGRRLPHLRQGRPGYTLACGAPPRGRPGPSPPGSVPCLERLARLAVRRSTPPRNALRVSRDAPGWRLSHQLRSCPARLSHVLRPSSQPGQEIPGEQMSGGGASTDTAVPEHRSTSITSCQFRRSGTRVDVWGPIVRRYPG